PAIVDVKRAARFEAPRRAKFRNLFRAEAAHDELRVMPARVHGGSRKTGAKRCQANEAECRFHCGAGHSSIDPEAPGNGSFGGLGEAETCECRWKRKTFHRAFQPGWRVRGRAP